MTVAWTTGTDESHWQTPSLAFAQQRKAAGDQFAIIKASDGTSTDASATAHHNFFGQVGIARGPYHFYRSQLDATAQAESHVAKAYKLGTWELPSTCDYENGGGAERPDDLLTYLDRIEALTGRTPIIYTGPAFWRQTIGGDARFARFPLWLAEYLNRYKDGNTLPTGFDVPAPSPWDMWDIWQWSDSSGRLDRDVMTAATFHMLTGTPAPTPNPPTTGGFLMALTDAEQKELLDKTRENDLRLQQIQKILLGDNPKLGDTQQRELAALARLEADKAKG